jgi:hypothetical protein
MKSLRNPDAAHRAAATEENFATPLMAERATKNNVRSRGCGA